MCFRRLICVSESFHFFSNFRVRFFGKGSQNSGASLRFHRLEADRNGAEREQFRVPWCVMEIVFICLLLRLPFRSVYIQNIVEEPLNLLLPKDQLLRQTPQFVDR